MSNEELNLGDIPGLGPVRRAALAEAGIHDLQGLLRLKLAELAAIRGVGLWQARKIAEFLRQRGLVLEVEIAGGEPSVVIMAPDTPEDRAAVAEAVDTLTTQAALEAHLEAEVAQLQEAVTAGQDGETSEALSDEEAALVDSSTATPQGYEQIVREAIARAEQPDLPAATHSTDSQNGAVSATTGAAESVAAEVQEESQVEETEEPAEGAEASEEEPETAPAEPDAWEGRIRDQREQLPEAALELMDAIRAAAVNQQLTRQITRLLITAGEFINDARPITPKQRQAASEALEQAEDSLRRAIEKRSFSPGQQKDLAARIRRRRKQLEQVLERE